MRLLLILLFAATQLQAQFFVTKNSAKSFVNTGPVNPIELSLDSLQRNGTEFSITDNGNSAGTFDYSIYSQAGSEVATGSSRTSNFTISTNGRYDVELNVTRGSNSINRYHPRYVTVRPAPFTEGQADVVLDLDAIEAGTFSNPLGDATIAGNGTTNFAYDFNDVTRAGLKIYVKGSFNGRINIIGLRGTLASPVRFQCATSGQTTFTATNTSQPYCLQFTTGNQYVEIDGSASTTHQYGFKMYGYIATATSGQMLFFSGSAQKGFEIHGVELDGRRGQGSATGGGAAIQFQPPTPTVSQHAGNYSQEYIRIYNNYIHDNFGEAIYIGYFTDALQAGYRPDRMGDVYVYRNLIERTNRDGIQVGSSDYCEIFQNIIRDVGEEANSSHNSAISWNGGNLDSFIYQNYAENCDTFTSAQNDDTGTGDYYFYSNFAKQRSSPLSGSMNQFLFLNVEGATCDFHIFNNTFICPAVVVAPVCIQHDNVGTYESLNFTFAGNVISTGGTNQSTWLELRRISTPSNTSNWYISNTFRRTASESELLINLTNGTLTSEASPAFSAGFDWAGRFSGVTFPGGLNRDRIGYTNYVNSAYTAGMDGGRLIVD